MRAKSVIHVEYELIKHIINNLDLSAVKDAMVPNGDKVAAKRFNTAGVNVKKLFVNMGQRRQHRLPEEHADFKTK